MLSQLSPVIIEILLGILVLMLLGEVIRLEIKIKRLLLGKGSVSIEDSLVKGNEEISKLTQFKKDATEHFLNIEKRLDRSIQAVETMRFNPFKGTGDGGNQSFTTAFLSQKGDGVTISSLYSRDRISVFSKPIEKFKSNFELTPEEIEVLDKAQKNLN